MFDWLKKKPAPEPEAPPVPVVKPGKKLSIVDIRDYPRSLYSAYWEYGVGAHKNGRWWWAIRMVDYQTGDYLNTAQGEAASENEARRQAQTWALEQIENFRRVRPAPDTEAITEPQGIA